MKADRLKHGRPKPTIAIVCDCECSRFEYCPAEEDSHCKLAYKEFLKALKAEQDKKAS